MDVIPILSTIILVSTLITLIVAIASYFVFRIKEKRKKSQPPELKAKPVEGRKQPDGKTGDIGETAKTIAGDRAIEQPAPDTSAKQAEANSKPAYDEIPADEEEEFEYEDEDEEEQELSPAQSAFMSSMKRIIAAKEPGTIKPEKKTPAGTPRLRRFTVDKKNQPETDGQDPTDEKSMWK